jgi:hypothetical protein
MLKQLKAWLRDGYCFELGHSDGKYTCNVWRQGEFSDTEAHGHASTLEKAVKGAQANLVEELEELDDEVSEEDV